MKKIFPLLMMIVPVMISSSVQAQQKATWNEMEEFHKVMSATFHPSEEGKLEPIKTRSQEMLDKAIAWKTSTAPQGYDQNAVKSSLKKLVKGSKELNKLVKKNVADNVLKEKLSALHDVFHEIMEKCTNEDHM